MLFPTLFLLVSVDLLYNQGVHGQNNVFFRRDYTYNEDFTSFYKAHKLARSWIFAKQKCQREGANLFYPETQAEAEFVSTHIKDKIKNSPQIWIGINDILSEGDYETITGVPIEDVYVDWNENEPNEVDDNNEDCVSFTKEAKMNDLTCDTKLPFVCKKTFSSVEWNALCEIPDINYMYDADLGKCYKFHLKPLNWTEAYAVCLAEQSYLAVINSQKEADFLVQMTDKAPKDRYKGNYLAGAVHLGFHNKYGEGFITVYGTPLEESGYIAWGGGQPDNQKEEFCGSMFYNGGLNDMRCSNICYFICEHDIGGLSSDLGERFNFT